jgi:hypothetical protein
LADRTSFFHVRPPSVDLKMPPVVLPLQIGMHRALCGNGYSTSIAGSITIIAPAGVSGQSAGELRQTAAINRLNSRIADCPELSDRRHVDDVRILRVRYDARNLERVPESDVRERRPPIGRFVNPIAPGDTVPVICLAGSDPDQVPVTLKDLDVAN